MATEAFTYYPTPDTRSIFLSDSGLIADRLDQIFRSLGAVDQRLSRIEELMSKNQPRE